MTAIHQMGALFEGNRNITTTENGDLAFRSTTNKCLDFFVKITRTADIKTILNSFIDAWNENNNVAIKLLLNFRDPRNGKGEKFISRTILFFIKLHLPPLYSRLLPHIVEYGSWKDLLHLAEMTHHHSNKLSIEPELTLFAQTLSSDWEIMKSGTNLEKFTLCAKWAPSENSHFDKKPLLFARKIMGILQINQKAYRNMLGGLREHLRITEKFMATDRWSEIDPNIIPSRCHTLYRKAFKRLADDHSHNRNVFTQRYTEYLEKLHTGDKTVKINSVGIQPHEITTKIFTHGADTVLNSQWKTMADRIKSSGSFNNALAIVDVSGSMSGQPMDVAIALGALVSECSSGNFKNVVVTFSESPTVVMLAGDLETRIRTIKAAPWGYNTNMERVFDLVLNSGISYNIPPIDMIKKIFIFTDMQFDKASGNIGAGAFKAYQEKFGAAGYELPQIVCWNLRTASASSSVPVTIDENGVCLLSGFSQELLKLVMEETRIFTPGLLLDKAVASYPNLCDANVSSQLYLPSSEWRTQFAKTLQLSGMTK
ncbi:DUF2828 domain-containing protein [bacterium]|nr:DUF2828 domain-containing protein [bacterium]